MITIPNPSAPKRQHPKRTKSLFAILIAVAILAASCTTMERLAEKPAEVSGATAVGMKSCAECHEDKVAQFKKTAHGRAGGLEAGSSCETCHGNGSLHVENGGAADKIVKPNDANCLACHGKDKERAFWKGSAHSGPGGGCVSCHQMHSAGKRLLKHANQSETCFECHAQVRADILKRSKHPLRDSAAADGEGKMQCASCHNPHGAKGEKLLTARSVNDKCYECHTEKRAPMLWEHSPVKEDCLTCHAAHGSINDKMLVTKVPRLCQQCHMQGRHQSGAFASNSAYLLNRGCLHCHPMVHGSNNPSGSVMQR